MKLLRSSVIKEAKLDYVRTAYSRGNRTNDVLYKHVLKNALIPVVTFLGMALADMIAGSIIIAAGFQHSGTWKNSADLDFEQRLSGCHGCDCLHSSSGTCGEYGGRSDLWTD